MFAQGHMQPFDDFAYRPGGFRCRTDAVPLVNRVASRHGHVNRMGYRLRDALRDARAAFECCLSKSIPNDFGSRGLFDIGSFRRGKAVAAQPPVQSSHKGKRRLGVPFSTACNI